MADDAASIAVAGKTFDVSVSYRSPSNDSFDITKPLVPPADAGVEAKIKYLKNLREAVISSQEEINRNLTARMEEDKARETQGPKTVVDEAKEEENYGEEVQED
ncbi:hypothetical protein GQ53DRAFT_816618 [Thozetella sp. PMI_491]|nr:hypothetical protein GQ53DRAFT_816618 [Thozetella sp. PMI_491]